MKVIYKYNIMIDDEFTIQKLPVDYKVVAVALQNGRPMMWIEHQDPNSATSFADVKFHIFGTGQYFEPEWGQEHLGTLIMHEGRLVWHIYGKRSLA